MALSVTYTTVNGMLAHEVRGGVDTVYVPDTLGSTAKTITPSTGLTYSAIYWPYGEVRTASGKNPSPWGFVGLLGYMIDIGTQIYVRARTYRPTLGRWQTVDPLWPTEPAFEYSYGNPISYVDPSGKFAACAVCAGCLGASVAILLLMCLDAANIMDCVQCQVLANPVLAIALLACLVVCAACVGSWLLRWAPKLPKVTVTSPGRLVPSFGGYAPQGFGRDDCRGRKKKRKNVCVECKCLCREAGDEKLHGCRGAFPSGHTGFGYGYTYHAALQRARDDCNSGFAQNLCSLQCKPCCDCTHHKDYDLSTCYEVKCPDDFMNY